MRTDKEYSQAMAQAKENLVDLNEWGTDAIGGNVLEFMDRIFTSDEVVESKYGSSTKVKEQEKAPEKVVEIAHALQSLVGVILYTDMSLEELKKERLKKYENIERHK